MNFAEASAVAPFGPGLYRAQAQPGWDIFGVTNGGYVLAIAARAMGLEAPGRSLTSIAGRFINPTRPGELKVAVRNEKKGRGLSVLSATVTADDKPLIVAHATFSEPDLGAPEHVLAEGGPPVLPPVEECVLLKSTGDTPLPPPFTDQVEVYLHPEDLVYFGSERSRPPIIRGWFRLRDDELLDPLGLVLASDAFPPAVFNSGLPIGWTPTVDLTVHIRQPGPHPWLACLISTRFVSGGWLEEDTELWTLDGTLAAQSRQLALLAR